MMKINKKNFLYNKNNKDLTEIVDTVCNNINLESIKSNCQQVAHGVIFRLNINPDGKELTTIIGDGSDYDNFHAVSSWVFENEPNLTVYNHDITEEYTSELMNILEDKISYY